jgi:hypothetical protein
LRGSRALAQRLIAVSRGERKLSEAITALDATRRTTATGGD